MHGSKFCLWEHANELIIPVNPHILFSTLCQQKANVI